MLYLWGYSEITHQPFSRSHFYPTMKYNTYQAAPAFICSLISSAGEWFVEMRNHLYVWVRIACVSVKTNICLCSSFMSLYSLHWLYCIAVHTYAQSFNVWKGLTLMQSRKRNKLVIRDGTLKQTYFRSLFIMLPSNVFCLLRFLKTHLYTQDWCTRLRHFV